MIKFNNTKYDIIPQIKKLLLENKIRERYYYDIRNFSKNIWNELVEKIICPITIKILYFNGENYQRKKSLTIVNNLRYLSLI